MKLVSIIDDSIGAVAFHRLIRDYSNKYQIYIDNLYYPYGLREKSIGKLSNDLFEIVKESDFVVSLNPSISLMLEPTGVINGLSFFENNYKEDSLIITNSYFKKHLEEKDYKNIEDSRILTNLVVDFNFNDNLIKEIFREYIGDFKRVYMLDSSLYLLKEYLIDYFPDVEFIYSTDYVLEEFKSKVDLKLGKNKSKIYVSAYRRGVYLSLEEHYKDRYVGIKKYDVR